MFLDNQLQKKRLCDENAIHCGDLVCPHSGKAFETKRHLPSLFFFFFFFLLQASLATRAQGYIFV